MGWFDEVAGGVATGGRNTTQPAGAPTGMGSGGSSGGGNVPYSDSALQEILHRYPPTNDGMRQAMVEINRLWPGQVELLEHPHRLDKLRLPNGQIIDTIGGAGGSNPSWAWMPEGPGHGGGAAGGAAGGAMAGMDPSYAFRFAEGQKALEKSAAAKGTLLTGGTLKALANYGQQMASTEFGNIFDRNYRVAGLGLNAANSAAGLSNNQAQTNTGLTTSAANARAWQQAASGNAWGGTIRDLGGLDWTREEPRTGALAPSTARTPGVPSSLPRYNPGGDTPIIPSNMWVPYSNAQQRR